MTISINEVRAAQVELLNGLGEGTGAYYDTVAQSYEDNADSYIDILRYPANILEVILNYRGEDTTEFNIKLRSGEIAKAYDFGGEYLGVDYKGVFSLFAIDSNI